MLKVVYHDGLYSDLHELEFELTAAVVSVIRTIAVTPASTRNRLLDHSEVGDLTSCFKAYVDPDPKRFPAQPARYRLVYQLLPDAKSPEYVHVIAFGLRDGLEAYRRAAQRLNRD